MEFVLSEKMIISIQRERARARGKLNRNDDIVKAGCGEHVPKKFKKKHRDDWKREVRDYLD